MASERSVLSVLGAGLPTATNWLDVEWVLALFELCSNGVEFLEFQIWASTVTHCILFTPDIKTHAEAPVLPGAWGVSQILGTELPGVENWLNIHWLKALFTLKSRGVKFAALRSWSRNVAVGSSFSPEMDSSRRHLGLVESLPNLLINTQALQHKSPESIKFVEELDRSRFYEKEYLEDIKKHLDSYAELRFLSVGISVLVVIPSVVQLILYEIGMRYHPVLLAEAALNVHAFVSMFRLGGRSLVGSTSSCLVSLDCLDWNRLFSQADYETSRKGASIALLETVCFWIIYTLWHRQTIVWSLLHYRVAVPLSVRSEYHGNAYSSVRLQP